MISFFNIKFFMTIDLLHFHDYPHVKNIHNNAPRGKEVKHSFIFSYLGAYIHMFQCALIIVIRRWFFSARGSLRSYVVLTMSIPLIRKPWVWKPLHEKMKAALILYFRKWQACHASMDEHMASAQMTNEIMMSAVELNRRNKEVHWKNTISDASSCWRKKAGTVEGLKGSQKRLREVPHWCQITSVSCLPDMFLINTW